MKSEMKNFDATIEKKIVATPETPKLNKRRIIRSTLDNQYMKGLLLNKDVDYKIQRGAKVALD